VSRQCFVRQFNTDQAGYIQTINWFSSLQPSFVEDTVWAACVTALGEAVENAIYHTHSSSEITPLAKIEVTTTDEMIQMRIWDQGKGFNLEERLIQLPESIPLYAERGRGLWIINQIADHFSYAQAAENLNCLTIRKFWANKK